MTSIEEAWREWEAKTKPCPKIHSIGTKRPKIHIYEFRQFDRAIALLWCRGQALVWCLFRL